MGDKPDFATLFHNIEGDTINDRKKNFFKLLSSLQFSNEQQLESELGNVEPGTYQEELFYIDSLIHFKRIKELTEILKQGNEIHISKILKQEWFFASVFQDTDIEKFVIDFLPCLSYSIRKKLLSKISKCWTEEKMDILFDAIDKKYGLTVAYPILHKCSVSKIKLLIEENEIKLRSNQVLNIYEKSVELFIFYLDRFNKINCNKYEESKVLNQIALKNPELILSLEKEGKIKLWKLGRRTSKTIMAVAKDDIQKNSERYFKFLNKPIIIRKLGKNFQAIYKQLFPKTLGQLTVYCTSNRLLQYYPKNGRWNLFIETCNENFANQSLDEILLKFNSLKTFNPPKSIVLKWARIHYENQERNFTDYLKYYEPSEAVALIKDKINVSSNISDRKSLLCLMLSVCKQNEDLKTLEEVLKYICFRHRNEDSFTRIELLSKLSSDFQLDNFNENHWKYIDEQVKILKIQKEFSLYRFSDLIEKHLEFLFKNTKDYKIVLTEFIKDMAEESYITKLTLKDLSIVKRIYMEMARLVSKVLDKSTKFRTKQTKFLIMFLKFSLENPEYLINITDYPELVASVQQSFTKDANFDENDLDIIPTVIQYNIKFPSDAIPHGARIIALIQRVVDQEKSLSLFESFLTSIFTKRDRNQVENDILNFYFENLVENDPIRQVIRWFLKNEPKTLAPYITRIIKTSSDYHNLLDCKLIKQYSHLEFDKKAREFFMEKLDEKREIKEHFVDSLRILLSTDDFVNLINSRYLPKKEKLDLEDKEMKDVFTLQCEVLKTLTKVSEPYKTLPIVMKFCIGDFLQPALRALYSAFYRSPEKILYPYADILSKRAVSVRKHATFLSCAVLDKEHTLNLLKNTEETNVSTQKHQLSAAMKYFSKNPCRDLFHKVIESFDKVDVNDKETLDSLKDFVVPGKFRCEYVESCWKFFEGLESKGIKNKDYLVKLLETMQEEELLKTLSCPFILDIIKNHFTTIKNRLSRLDSFVMRVLRYRVSERTENFATVFDLLSKLPKKIRGEFFQEFITTADKTCDDDFLHIFDSNWNKHFTMIDSFDNLIYLKLFVAKRRGLETWVDFLVNYLEQLVDQFGYHSYDHFKEQLLYILSKLDEIEEYSIYLKILQFKLTPTTCILVLDLMSHVNEHETEELKKIYKDILAILENVDIPIVSINYSNFITNQCD